MHNFIRELLTKLERIAICWVVSYTDFVGLTYITGGSLVCICIDAMCQNLDLKTTLLHRFALNTTRK